MSRTRNMSLDRPVAASRARRLSTSTVGRDCMLCLATRCMEPPQSKQGCRAATVSISYVQRHLERALTSFSSYYTGRRASLASLLILPQKCPEYVFHNVRARVLLNTFLDKNRRTLVTLRRSLVHRGRCQATPPGAERHSHQRRFPQSREGFRRRGLCEAV